MAVSNGSTAGNQSHQDAVKQAPWPLREAISTHIIRDLLASIWISYDMNTPTPTSIIQALFKKEALRQNLYCSLSSLFLHPI